MEKKDRKFLNFQIPETLDAKIKEEADRLQVSKADFIRMCLIKYLEYLEEEPITTAT